VIRSVGPGELGAFMLDGVRLFGRGVARLTLHAALVARIGESNAATCEEQLIAFVRRANRPAFLSPAG
jgi:hypothetical protein